MKPLVLFKRLLVSLGLLAISLSISCSATSNTKQAINERSNEVQWLTGIDNCPHTVELYFEWHAKALSIGSSLELEEYNWLHKHGLRHSGPFYELYAQAIAQQQDIKQFESIAVACIQLTDLVDSIGKIDVTSISNTGDRKTHYFVDQQHHAFNVEHKNNPFGISAANEPVPPVYLQQLAEKVAGYENEIMRAKGLLTDFAVFNDDEVELLVNWPDNVIATTTINKTTRSDRSSDVTKQPPFVLEENYTRTDNRMKVSTVFQKSQAMASEQDDEKWPLEKETLDGCVRDERFICTMLVYGAVPIPYYIEPPNYFRTAVLDTDYVQRANKWMDSRYADSEYYRKFMRLTNKELNRIIEEEEPIFELRERDTFFVELLNGLRLKKGEFTPIDWRIFTTWTQKTFKYQGKHELKHGVTYQGKTPCQADDPKDQCAKIKFEREVLNPAEGTSDNIHYVLTLDFVVEPHTLLVHSYNAHETRSIKNAIVENSREEFIENNISSTTAYRKKD